jgi:four helix bundle protein
MERNEPIQFTKPYDLRERLFEYACAIVRVVQYLHGKDGVARSLSDQILRAGNSAGANYQEADDGSSPADTRGKRRISLRELKECLFRLRVLRATGYLGPEYDLKFSTVEGLRLGVLGVGSWTFVRRWELCSCGIDSAAAYFARRLT